MILHKINQIQNNQLNSVQTSPQLKKSEYYQKMPYKKFNRRAMIGEQMILNSQPERLGGAGTKFF